MFLMHISKLLSRKTFKKMYKPTRSVWKCLFHSIISQIVANVKEKNYNTLCLNIFSYLLPSCICFLNCLFLTFVHFLRYFHWWFLSFEHKSLSSFISRACSKYFSQLAKFALNLELQLILDFVLLCLILCCLSFL